MIKSENIESLQITELKQSCLNQANYYLKELGYGFSWDNYDKFIQKGPRKTRFNNFGYYYCFNDRGDVLRFWKDYYDTSQENYKIFYSEKVKNQIQSKPWRVFNEVKYKQAKELYNYLEISRQNIQNLMQQKKY